MRRMVLLVTVLTLGMLLACQSGSAIGIRKSCSRQKTLESDTGRCEGGWKKLSGSTTLEIENEDIWSFDQIPVNMQISVESGVVQVSCGQQSGEKMTVQARPGQPGVLATTCEAESEELDIAVETLDGEATGIEFIIEYEIP